MSDPVKQAWNEVSDGFSSLGRLMKDRLGAAESTTESSEQEHERSETAFRAALETVVAAAREFGERAADIVKDPELKAQAKLAIGSLNAALTATADQVGEDVRGLLKRASTKGATEDRAPEPPGPSQSSDTGFEI